MVAEVSSSDRPLMLSNDQIAEQLEEVARRLEPVDDNRFRVNAYRDAARAVRQVKAPIANIAAKDPQALTRIPGIGDSIARQIAASVKTGQLPLLERLPAPTAHELFASVAEIGPKLARRVHDELKIETLSELYAAACDGRLASVPGFGPKRVRGVREALAGRGRETHHQFPHRGNLRWRGDPKNEPSAALLLDIDRQYREMATAGRLRKIAPKRFNPTRQAWLPILHTYRDGRQYTAMYSNTIRAHEMGTTDDWVVIYTAGKQTKGQWTVITGQFGSLKGRRIVRGREWECKEYYRQRDKLTHAEQADQSATTTGRSA